MPTNPESVSTCGAPQLQVGSGAGSGNAGVHIPHVNAYSIAVRDVRPVGHSEAGVLTRSLSPW